MRTYIVHFMMVGGLENVFGSPMIIRIDYFFFRVVETTNQCGHVWWLLHCQIGLLNCIEVEGHHAALIAMCKYMNYVGNWSHPEIRVYTLHRISQ